VSVGDLHIPRIGPHTVFSSSRIYGQTDRGNISIAHRYMNAEIGTEAAQFLFLRMFFLSNFQYCVFAVYSMFTANQRCEAGIWLLWQEFARRTNIGVAVLEPHLDSETVTPILTHSINRTESIRPTIICQSNLKRTYMQDLCSRSMRGSKRSVPSHIGLEYVKAISSYSILK
jgi:hypothetical protein